MENSEAQNDSGRERVRLIEDVWHSTSGLPTTKSPCPCGRGVRSNGRGCLLCCVDKLTVLTNGEIANAFVGWAWEFRRLAEIVRDGPEDMLPLTSGEDRQAAVDLVWRIAASKSVERTRCACGREDGTEDEEVGPRCPRCLVADVVRLGGIDRETASSLVRAARAARAVDAAIRQYDPNSSWYGAAAPVEADARFEPGVCVCCAAATKEKFNLTPTLVYSVCPECGEDGSFIKFLARELEAAAVAGGFTVETNAEGKRILVAPEDRK